MMTPTARQKDSRTEPRARRQPIFKRDRVRRGGTVLLTLSWEIGERRARGGLQRPSRFDPIAPPTIRAPFVLAFLRRAVLRDPRPPGAGAVLLPLFAGNRSAGSARTCKVRRASTQSRSPRFAHPLFPLSSAVHCRGT